MLVVALMTIASAISTAVVLAGGADEFPGVDKLSSKVAAILGLDETVVDDAISQARRELRDEYLQAVTAKLAGLVEKGEFTQEQDDEKLRSLALKKKAVSKDEYLQALEERLAALVENGELTQEQADEKLKSLALKKKAVSKDEYLQALEEKFAALVEKGELTQEQVDEKLKSLALKKKATYTDEAL